MLKTKLLLLNLFLSINGLILKIFEIRLIIKVKIADFYKNFKGFGGGQEILLRLFISLGMRFNYEICDKLSE